MGYFDLEEKTELELEVYKNQRLAINFIFLYLIGIIVLLSVFINTNKGILNLLYLTIAPISSIGWLHFTNKIYDFKASVYNRFGSNRLYYWLSIFWGNKQLPVIALLLSLILVGSSFVNLFVLEISVRKDLTDAKQNIVKLKQVNENTFKQLEYLKQLTNSLGKKNPSITQQEEFQKMNEKLNNIKNSINATPPNPR